MRKKQLSPSLIRRRQRQEQQEQQQQQQQKQNKNKNKNNKNKNNNNNNNNNDKNNLFLSYLVRGDGGNKRRDEWRDVHTEILFMFLR